MTMSGREAFSHSPLLGQAKESEDISVVREVLSPVLVFGNH